MAAGRTFKSLVGRRRRLEDEGEDEDDPVLLDDSQSEASALTEVADGDADGSSAAGGGIAELTSATTRQTSAATQIGEPKGSKSRKPRKQAGKKPVEGPAAEIRPKEHQFQTVADTQVMLNGMQTKAESRAEDIALDFDSLAIDEPPPTSTSVQRNATGAPVDQWRREHEEYKKKRDANPAFIPNRGMFFMHDTRGQRNGQPPMPKDARLGRHMRDGGASIGGPFSPLNQMAQAERETQQAWKHDLHDTINEEPVQQLVPVSSAQSSNERRDAQQHFLKPIALTGQRSPRVLTFSSTTLVGKVHIRVLLPHAKAPSTYSDVSWKHYIRLPDHRPPLRRDKPVRVSLPGHDQRHVFPPTERSFVFIPRQSRANQQMYQRGGYQRSLGGHGYSSRRTSMYGGSMYSGSAAPSRRSSMAGVSRASAFSPAGSVVGIPPSRPVVRLPHGTPQFSAVSSPAGPLSGYQTPVGKPQIHTYPLPQKPALRGTPTSTVHQPRPQKTISVTGIESPMLQQTPGDATPFQNQLPRHINEHNVYQQQPPPSFAYSSPPQPFSHPYPQLGTPLSGVPEQAMHTASYQQPYYGQTQYYPSYAPQQSYYQPPPDMHGYSSMSMYMPPQQNYMVSQPGSMIPNGSFSSGELPPPQTPTADTSSNPAPPQSGMVAHESNGMVFYVPAAEAQQSAQYQPAEGFVPSYAMPGLPPPTPAPENAMEFYHTPYPAMEDSGGAGYYPAQVR